MKKKMLVTLSATLAAALVLTACGGNTASSSAASSSAASAGSSASEPAASTWQPSGTIKLICPYNAGSVGDTFSRPFAEIMSKYAGVSVVVENMGGGSGSVGTQYMLSQPADGLTFSYHSNTGALNIAGGSAPFGKEDLVPICNIGSDFHTLCVKSDSQFQTLQDLVDYAKENPGQMNIASAQIMGNNHLFALLFMRDFDVECNYIPYDDGAASCLGLMGNNADCVMSTASTTRGYLESGDFRCLAYTLPEPVEDELYKDAVTFASAGSEGLANYISFKGMFLNPECSDEIKAWYDDICGKVCNDPEWLEFLELQGSTPTYMDMEEFTQYYNEYIDSAAQIFAEVT